MTSLCGGPILAGIVVVGYPFDSLVILTLVIGIWLIITGVMEIIASFRIRGDQKKLTELRVAATKTEFAPPRLFTPSPCQPGSWTCCSRSAG
jgi:hypothetical protein